MQRYGFDAFGAAHPGGVIIPADNGPYVLYADHEAEIASALAEERTVKDGFVSGFIAGRREGFTAGYAAAIRVARNEAAIALMVINTYLPPDERNAVLNAIESLGGER